MDITIFKKLLQKLYKRIDKASNLLWSHRNHITGNGIFDEEETFYNRNTTQIGYGEISMSSMTQLLNLFLNIDTLIKSSINTNVLKYDSYNINKDSYFMDIGSGFGKPIFHAAFQIGCHCQGIEVVPARVEFCEDFKYEYLVNKNFFEIKDINNIEKINNNNNNNDELNNNLTNKFKEKDIKPVLKKTVIDFSFNYGKNFNFKYEWYNKYILNFNIKENEYCFGIIDYLEKIEKNFYEKNIKKKEFENKFEYLNFKKYKKKNIFNNGILFNNEYLIEFNKPFINLKKIQIKSNEKLSNKLGYIIIHNLYLNEFEKPYVPIYFNDFNSINNLFLLDYLSYINNNFIYIPFIFHEIQNFNFNFLTSYNHKKNEKRSFLINLNNNINNEFSDTEETLSNSNSSDLTHNLLTKFKSTEFNPEFYNLCSFISIDATKYKSYKYIEDAYNFNEDNLNNFDDLKNNHHFTHIYSYNKLMGEKCRKKISKILNRTDWRVLAWYSNEKQTKESGLRHFFKITSFQMVSTGNEKYNCYIYIKINV